MPVYLKILFSSFQKSPQLFNKEDFLPLDSTQELIFPPELIVSRIFSNCQGSQITKKSELS